MFYAGGFDACIAFVDARFYLGGVSGRVYVCCSAASKNVEEWMLKACTYGVVNDPLHGDEDAEAGHVDEKRSWTMREDTGAAKLGACDLTGESSFLLHMDGSMH